MNVASRLESNGEPGMIQVSESTFHLLWERCAFGDQRTVELKGRGPHAGVVPARSGAGGRDPRPQSSRGGRPGIRPRSLGFLP
jgi:class 3 adenylate cyclase